MVEVVFSPDSRGGDTDLSIGEDLKNGLKKCGIYTIEWYSTIKKKDVLPSGDHIEMDLISTMLGELSEMEKENTIAHLLWNQKKSKLIQTE